MQRAVAVEQQQRGMPRPVGTWLRQKQQVHQVEMQDAGGCTLGSGVWAFVNYSAVVRKHTRQLLGRPRPAAGGKSRGVSEQAGRNNSFWGEGTE
jgi:hypothetical protein